MPCADGVSAMPISPPFFTCMYIKMLAMGGFCVASSNWSGSLPCTGKVDYMDSGCYGQCT